VKPHILHHCRRRPAKSAVGAKGARLFESRRLASTLFFMADRSAAPECRAVARRSRRSDKPLPGTTARRVPTPDRDPKK